MNIRRTTQGGTLFVDEEGGPWRCMTFVDKATSHETVESPAMLREAARDAGVQLRQIEARQQSCAHPILWGVPETSYLKFYLFQVV